LHLTTTFLDRIRVERIMQTGNHHPRFNNDDPTWNLVAEYFLNKVNVDEDIAAELTTGSLFHTMHELGLPPECLKKIEGTITEISRGAKSHLNHERLNLPVHIRLFCHRMPQEGLPHSGKQKNGGWGYYLIERGVDLPSVLCDKYHRAVELYLYKEGD
jgi:hypothetical protein